MIRPKNYTPKVCAAYRTGHITFGTNMHEFYAYHYDFKDCDKFFDTWHMPCDEVFMSGWMECDYDTNIPEQYYEFRCLRDWVLSTSARAKYMLMMTVLANKQHHGECWV